MNLEIERKWLLEDFPPIAPTKEAIIKQFYISTDPEVRFRESNNHYSPYKMTIKSKGTLTRQEIEFEIDRKVWEEGLQFIGDKKPIHKLYRTYLVNGYKIEVSQVDDNFIYAEVEFCDEDEANNYQFPFDGKEITYDPTFKMSSYWERTRN